jgi:aryl-alcohol dehydrogenase-like predicted oxidoreductase
VDALVELQQQGKIQHIGVSNVDERLLGIARARANIASVQNRYNFGDRESETLVDLCEREGMAFLPWAPIHDIPETDLTKLAAGHHAAPRQVVLAWLLARSPAILPIPGTGSVAHLEANIAAAGLRLEPDEVASLAEMH